LLAHFLAGSVEHSSSEFLEVAVDAELVSGGDGVGFAVVPGESLEFVDDLGDLGVGSCEVVDFGGFWGLWGGEGAEAGESAHEHAEGFACACWALDEGVLGVEDCLVQS
jgi:hypothetical protein